MLVANHCSTLYKRFGPELLKTPPRYPAASVGSLFTIRDTCHYSVFTMKLTQYVYPRRRLHYPVELKIKFLSYYEVIL